ncbi:unnamed protein product [Sphagnum tenellum]
MIANNTRLVVYMDDQVGPRCPAMAHERHWIGSRKNNYRTTSQHPLHFDCAAYLPYNIRRNMTLINHQLNVYIQRARQTPSTNTSPRARNRTSRSISSASTGEPAETSSQPLTHYNGVVRPQMQGERGYDAAISQQIQQSQSLNVTASQNDKRSPARRHGAKSLHHSQADRDRNRFHVVGVINTYSAFCAVVVMQPKIVKD